MVESKSKSSDAKPQTGLFADVARMDERLAKYGLPLNKDLLTSLNTFDKAHTVMMSEQGIVTRQDAAKILSVLKKVDEIGPDGFPWGKGDLWAQKEKFVVGEIGEEVGGRLHTGRSRQDVGCTTDRLYLRTKILDMADRLNDFRATLLDTAEKHIETVMPCYTWIQHAQPTTFAHYLMSFAYGMARDYDRIVHAYRLTNMSPAGAALQTGTSYPLDRERTKQLMGFEEVIRNTRDAAMNFDYLYEILTAASMTVSDLLKMLEEFALWHSIEFNMISLDDPWCVTSSIMPQKRNPLPFTLIRGKASRIFGRTTEFFNTLEGPCLGPSRPHYLESDTEEAIGEFLGIFIIAEGFLSSLRVNKVLMRQRAGGYWAQGTDLADTIVKEKGLSFRTAHHIIAQLVKDANEMGKTPADVNAEMIDQAAREVIDKPLGLSDETVRKALDPSLAIRIRKVFGGTSPDDVTAQIRESRERLKLDRQQIESFKEKIEKAKKELEVAVNAVTGG